VTLIPPHDPLLGALSMDEVYFDQEGPRFFSATSRSGRRFLAVAVDEDESSDTYLYPARFRREVRRDTWRGP
jgi:hypothetical protein